MSEPVVALCTCPPASADALARGIVEARLAACVNRLGDCQSTYRWQDTVETDSETLLVIKTTRSRMRELERFVSENHPYELPELIAVPITDGLPGYLNWINEETLG